MYAIIEDSGSQFRVSEGDVLNVDLRELPEGSTTIEFGRVLLVSGENGVKVGAPLVDGAKVVAQIVDGLAAGPKLHHWYFNAKKHSRRKIGHRQHYVQVKISQIVA